MIILIGGEKGGTGKSTFATNLAALRARDGRDVLLLDTDRQGSAAAWSLRRDELQVAPRVPCLQKFGKGLQTEIADLTKRYDDIIIDAGGRDSVELRAALVVATKAFLPIQASQFDLWSLDRLEEIIETARGFNPDLVAYAVINRASTNPSVSEVKEVEELFPEFSQVVLSSAVIRERIVFRKAIREGLSVVEMQPNDPKADAEIIALYQEVFV